MAEYEGRVDIDANFETLGYPGAAWLGANANLSQTPLPPTYLLLGSGLLALLALGRRRESLIDQGAPVWADS